MFYEQTRGKDVIYYIVTYYKSKPPLTQKIGFGNSSFSTQQTIFCLVLILSKCTPDHVNVETELSFSQGLPL